LLARSLIIENAPISARFVTNEVSQEIEPIEPASGSDARGLVVASARVAESIALR
jgi:hypothetical protein